MTVDEDFQSLCQMFIVRLTLDTRERAVKWDRQRFGYREDENGEPFFTVTIGQYELVLMNWNRRPLLFGKPELRRLLHVYVAASNEPPRYREHIGQMDSSTVPELETLWNTLYRNESDMTVAVSSMYTTLDDAWIERTGI